MTLLSEKIVAMALECMRRGRAPAPAVTCPRDALDICGALVEALRGNGAAPDDCALTYCALALLRYLREKLPPGEGGAGERERRERLEAPLKINWTLSDRALYDPRTARAAGELREMMRGLAIKDDDTAFSAANLLRQAAVETGAVAPGSPLYRRCLALLDYLEGAGAGAGPGRPSYANGGRVPRESVFEVRIKYIPQEEGA